jgi:hypothetical protein
MDPESEKMLSKELRELQEVLIEVKHYWRKQSSLRWNFVKGIIYGFGFFIGSAVIVGFLLYLLTHLNISSDSLLGRFIQDFIEIMKKRGA